MAGSSGKSSSGGSLRYSRSGSGGANRTSSGSSWNSTVSGIKRPKVAISGVGAATRKKWFKKR